MQLLMCGAKDIRHHSLATINLIASYAASMSKLLNSRFVLKILVTISYRKMLKYVMRHSLEYPNSSP